MTANFHELLQKAIAIEARMAEFYDAMAKKATIPETREIFKILETRSRSCVGCRRFNYARDGAH